MQTARTARTTRPRRLSAAQSEEVTADRPEVTAVMAASQRAERAETPWRPSSQPGWCLTRAATFTRARSSSTAVRHQLGVHGVQQLDTKFAQVRIYMCWFATPTHETGGTRVTAQAAPYHPAGLLAAGKLVGTRPQAGVGRSGRAYCRGAAPAQSTSLFSRTEREVANQQKLPLGHFGARRVGWRS